MFPRFDNPKFIGFTLTPSLSPNYKGLILQGATPLTAAGQSGTITFQDIIQPEFRIHLQEYNLIKPLKIPANQENSFLVAFLSLKNTIHYFIKGLGQFKLKQGQFALLHSGDQEITANFDRGGSYQGLQVVWSEPIVQQALPYFSSLTPLFSDIEKRKSYYLHQPGQIAGTYALDVIHSLLSSPHDDATSIFFFKLKIQEYLLSILTKADKIPKVGKPLNDADYEKIVVLAETLSLHANQHFPIAKLAKEMQMNEMKLKQTFKKIFGMGIFEYHLEARMKEAHRLLRETTLNTKTIASLVGYEFGTSFITKFREYYGYPPSEVGKGR
jgi:AraC-like DNA-binding protein